MNLTKLSRNSKTTQTIIEVQNPVTYTWETFIQCGQIDVHYNERMNYWVVSSYLLDAVDFEYDAAKLFAFPVVGLHLDFISNGYACYDAFIDGSDFQSFRVPPEDYDPLKGAKKVMGKTVVDEGFYTPKHNEELFQKLRGRRMRIRTGPRGQE